DLAIPGRPIVLQKPGAKLRKLLRGERLDLLLDLLDLAHGSSPTTESTISLLSGRKPRSPDRGSPSRLDIQPVSTNPPAWGCQDRPRLGWAGWPCCLSRCASGATVASRVTGVNIRAAGLCTAAGPRSACACGSSSSSRPEGVPKLVGTGPLGSDLV